MSQEKTQIERHRQRKKERLYIFNEEDILVQLFHLFLHIQGGELNVA